MRSQRNFSDFIILVCSYDFQTRFNIFLRLELRIHLKTLSLLFSSFTDTLLLCFVLLFQVNTRIQIDRIEVLRGAFSLCFAALSCGRTIHGVLRYMYCSTAVVYPSYVQFLLAILTTHFVVLGFLLCIEMEAA